MKELTAAEAAAHVAEFIDYGVAIARCGVPLNWARFRYRGRQFTCGVGNREELRTLPYLDWGSFRSATGRWLLEMEVGERLLIRRHGVRIAWVYRERLAALGRGE